MHDNAASAQALTHVLELSASPIAVLFSSTPPEGLARVDAAAPAGCGYWKLAAAGQSFYTLGEPQKQELEQLIGTMVGLEYLSMDEVPQIPTRKAKLETVSYAPLAKATFAPDLVLVRAKPRQAMLIAEATHAAGVRDPGAAGMRPACAMIPAVLASQKGTHSLGCIGNRVYTGLPDDEIWAALPGASLPSVLEHLAKVANANQQLEAFHRARLPLAT
jgi:uncharacterized protein (DUF169 family)